MSLCRYVATSPGHSPEPFTLCSRSSTLFLWGGGGLPDSSLPYVATSLLSTPFLRLHWCQFVFSPSDSKFDIRRSKCARESSMQLLRVLRALCGLLSYVLIRKSKIENHQTHAGHTKKHTKHAQNTREHTKTRVIFFNPRTKSKINMQNSDQSLNSQPSTSVHPEHTHTRKNTAEHRSNTQEKHSKRQ